MTEPTIPEPITPQEFERRYNELCKECGYVLVFEPQWKRSADMGDYRLVLAPMIAKLEQSAQ